MHDAAGELAGTNRIDPILGGCVPQENWQGAGSMSGKSFNIFSAADGKWHQTWVGGGRVLQTWDLSTDGGGTWQVVFQGTYSHKS